MNQIVKETALNWLWRTRLAKSEERQKLLNEKVWMIGDLDATVLQKQRDIHEVEKRLADEKAAYAA